MKKLLSVLITLTLMFSISAIAQAEESGLLSRIKAKGELVVATEGAWAPWTYHDESDSLVGFDVEVAQAIAKKLGVSASFVECEWDSIFAGMDSGRYDIAANGIEVTDERAEKYDFSSPYGYIRTALIVRGDQTSISSFEDLDGKRTANSIASTYMTLAESYGAQAVGVDTLDQTIDMVLAGRADATLNAEVSFYDYMRVHPDANLKVIALTEEASRVSIPVRKGAENAGLLDAINKAIAELGQEGELTRISEKYFGKDISKAPRKPGEAQDEAKNDRALTLTAKDVSFTVALEDNETADAFVSMLPMTLSMSELHGNEKYFYLDGALPSASKDVGQIQAGDLMLYGDDCVVLFYKSFTTSYRYTRIGRIDNAEGLLDAVGQGNADISFSR